MLPKATPCMQTGRITQECFQNTFSALPVTTGSWLVRLLNTGASRLAEPLHLGRHRRPRALSLPPHLLPLLVVHDSRLLNDAIQSQDLKQLGHLRVIPRRLHPVAPRDPLLLRTLPLLLDLALAGLGLLQRAELGMLLFPRRGQRRRDVERLEEELAADLAMVARLEGQALGHLPEALDDAVEDAL